MKKRLALLLVGMMTLALCACGSTSDSATESSEVSISTQIEEDMEDLSAEEASLADESVEEEATEGAPTVEEGRKMDEEAVPVLDIAGSYEAEAATASISIYTDMEENAAEVGNIEITDDEGNVRYSANLMQVMDNMYELQNEDVNLTIYTEDDGTIYFELYENGEFADDFTMTEHYVS